MTLTKEEMLKFFSERRESLKHYKKFGKFLARPVEEDELTVTIVGGRVETIKSTLPTDWVLKNINIGSSGEEWAISFDKFQERYELAPPKGQKFWYAGNSWYKVNANGEVWAFEYKGSPFKFIAPWGEEMECISGDYIANPVGGKEDDIYRIEGKTFLDTYTEF
jgi:hypothetical protein